jgi:hypothetical protein
MSDPRTLHRDYTGAYCLYVSVCAYVRVCVCVCVCMSMQHARKYVILVDILII